MVYDAIDGDDTYEGYLSRGNLYKNLGVYEKFKEIYAKYLNNPNNSGLPRNYKEAIEKTLKGKNLKKTMYERMTRLKTANKVRNLTNNNKKNLLQKYSNNPRAFLKNNNELIDIFNKIKDDLIQNYTIEELQDRLFLSRSQAIIYKTGYLAKRKTNDLNIVKREIHQAIDHDYFKNKGDKQRYEFYHDYHERYLPGVKNYMPILMKTNYNTRMPNIPTNAMTNAEANRGRNRTRNNKNRKGNGPANARANGLANVP